MWKKGFLIIRQFDCPPVWNANDIDAVQKLASRVVRVVTHTSGQLVPRQVHSLHPLGSNHGAMHLSDHRLPICHILPDTAIVSLSLTASSNIINCDNIAYKKHTLTAGNRKESFLGQTCSRLMRYSLSPPIIIAFSRWRLAPSTIAHASRNDILQCPSPHLLHNSHKINWFLRWSISCYSSWQLWAMPSYRPMKSNFLFPTIHLLEKQHVFSFVTNFITKEIIHFANFLSPLLPPPDTPAYGNAPHLPPFLIFSFIIWI